ncbi:hypothetical protein [Corallococcus exiguus]|uniref:hypothetical protein n=1 Tax=Corallococcus exiguus TaxID=83462 RepID=UPI0015615C8D|nr:hypothetical protein [Corallococcus exiguus]NRD46156.1 hypothetical protein [Corallococcus exiguus]
MKQSRAITMSGHPLLFLFRRAERRHFQVDLISNLGVSNARYTLKVTDPSLAAQATLVPGVPVSPHVTTGAVRVLPFDAMAGTRYRLTPESTARGAPSSKGVLTYTSVFGTDVAPPYVWGQQVGLKGTPASTEFTATRTERLTVTLVAAHWWDPAIVTATVDILQAVSGTRALRHASGE